MKGKINFKNYCIVVMGETEGALLEIAQICDAKPKVLNARGIVICTFTTVVDVKEMEDYFTSLGRSFFLFEVGSKNTGYHLNNAKIHEALFSEMEDNPDKLKDLSNKLMDEINNTVPFESTSGRTEEDIPVINLKMKSKTVKSEVRPNKAYFEGLDSVEKAAMIDEILDKGIDNLNEFDKRVLKIITKDK